MALSVAVPSSLLEDIFRLLDYLGDAGDHDELHFHKTGCSTRLEHDNALWELKFKIKQLQGQIVETYLLTVDDIAEDETDSLKEWIADGNSVYDNPYSLCDGSGRPMDFINGCRTGIEMAERPPRFFWDEPDAVDNGGWDEDIPF